MSAATRSPGRPAEHEDDGLPVLDMSKPMIISAWGRKGSGKSFFNRRMYDSWVGDKLCIDVNGNADPGPDAIKITELPNRWPDPPVRPLGSPPPGPQNVEYRADPGSPDYFEDLDRAVNLALMPQDHRTLVWCGEVAEFMPSAGTVGPSMRRLLQQNRHYNVTALFDGPRPVSIHPLVLAQSDLIAIYHLPNPADRKRVADSMGYPPDRFETECAETWRRGKHWYLLWWAPEHKLFRCPPLPLDEE